MVSISYLYLLFLLYSANFLSILLTLRPPCSLCFSANLRILLQCNLFKNLNLCRHLTYMFSSTAPGCLHIVRMGNRSHLEVSLTSRLISNLSAHSKRPLHVPDLCVIAALYLVSVFLSVSVAVIVCVSVYVSATVAVSVSVSFNVWCLAFSIYILHGSRNKICSHWPTRLAACSCFLSSTATSSPSSYPNALRFYSSGKNNLL